MQDNILGISPKKELSSHYDSFNYVDYIFEFDFCNIREKNILYRCLKDAWEWAYPSH